jgi:hypothetical protein
MSHEAELIAAVVALAGANAAQWLYGRARDKAHARALNEHALRYETLAREAMQRLSPDSED